MTKLYPVGAALAAVIAALPAGAAEQPAQILRHAVADQEQRLRAQEARIEAVRRQVEALMAASKSNLAAAGPPPPRQQSQPAQTQDRANTVVAGEKKVRLAISGQINRGLLIYGDGRETKVRSVDNKNSSTRVRFVATARINGDLTIGGKIELGIESNSSAKISQADATVSRASVINERYTDLYVASKKWGRLSLGQGDMASNKTSEVDLSGTSVAGSADMDDTGGGLFFAEAGGALSGIRADRAFNHMDGLGRNDRIRYDTPSLGGFAAAISRMDGGAWDLALRYGQKLGPVSFKAAAAFENFESASSTIDNQYNGSLSVLHNNGLNLTFAWGARDTKGVAAGRNPRFLYWKLGQRLRLIPAGVTALAIEYGNFDELHGDGEDGRVWGLQAVQNIKAWSVELFAAFRHYDLDAPGQDLDNLDIFLTGARIKF